MKTSMLTFLCGLLLLTAYPIGADSGSSSSDAGTPQANPQQTQADYAEGHRYLQAGEYKAAIKAFKRVVAVDDTHAMAYTNMAYSYRQLGNFKRAIKLYEKALALNPNLAEAHEYMGGALVALGKIEEAKKHLVILQGLDPKLADELRAEIARHNRS